jgi:hypothetical protein
MPCPGCSFSAVAGARFGEGGIQMRARHSCSFLSSTVQLYASLYISIPYLCKAEENDAPPPAVAADTDDDGDDDDEEEGPFQTNLVFLGQHTLFFGSQK